MQDRLFPALLALAVALFVGVAWLGAGEESLPVEDAPLPDLPAVTLDGHALDRAFFGDRRWLVAVWLPG